MIKSILLHYLIKNKCLKDLLFPKPGPTLEIAEAAAENAVIKSKLKKLRLIADNINKKYI